MRGLTRTERIAIRAVNEGTEAETNVSDVIFMRLIERGLLSTDICPNCGLHFVPVVTTLGREVYRLDTLARR